MIAFRLAWLRLRRTPLRSLLALAAVIAAACVAAWITAGYDEILRHAEDDARTVIGNADCYLAPRRGDAERIGEEFLSRLKKEPRVVQVSCFTTCDINIATRKNPAPPPPLYGLPRRAPVLVGTDATASPRELLDGDWLGGTPGDAVVNEKTAERMRLQCGSRLRVRSAAGFFTLRVKGIIAENPAGGNFSSISDSDLLRAPPSNLIYVSRKDAERIAGGPLPVSYALVKLRDGTDAVSFAKEWSRDRMICVSAGALERAFRSGERAANARMQAYSAGAVCLLVSFFLIFSVLTMELEERRRDFAMLRIVGLTSRQVFASFLCEAFFFAAAGWIGAVFSAGLLRYLLRLPCEPGFWSVTAAGVCAAAGAFAAALFPAWRAGRVAPLEAFTRPEPATGMLDGWKWKLAFAVLIPWNPLIVFLPGIPEDTRILLYGVLGCPMLILAFLSLTPSLLRWMERWTGPLFAWLLHLNPLFFRSQLDAGFRRGALLCAALSAGLGFYMMIVIWCASLLLPFLPGEWMPDLFAAIVPGGLRKEKIAEIQRHPAVKKILPVSVEQVRLAEDLTGSRKRKSVVRQDNLVFIGVDAESGYAGADALLPFRYLSPDREAALKLLRGGGRYCLIPKHFAQVSGLRPGDSFEVVPPGDPERRLRYTVAGIIEFKGWHWFSKFSGTRRNTSRTAAMVFGTERRIAEDFHLPRVNFLWMNTVPEAENELKILLERLAEESRGEEYSIPGKGRALISAETVKLTSREWLRNSVLSRTDMVVNGMLNLPLTILWTMVFAVASASFGAVCARRRELWIMRMTGLTASGACRLIFGEFLMIGLAASVLSLFYGIVSGICSAQMASHLSFFGGMGWNFVLPWGRILTGTLITLGVCFLGTLGGILMQGRRVFYESGERKE